MSMRGRAEKQVSTMSKLTQGTFSLQAWQRRIISLTLIVGGGFLTALPQLDKGTSWMELLQMLGPLASIGLAVQIAGGLVSQADLRGN